MADSFKVVFDDAPVYDWLGELPDEVRSALQSKMNALGDVMKDKVAAALSCGLVMRSGRLESSLATKVETSGDKIVGTVSSSAPYAGAENYGVHKVEMVRATKREITEVFGSAKAGILADVRPHDRLMNIKGKDFMGLASEDVQASFVQQMTDAVSQALT